LPGTVSTLLLALLTLLLPLVLALLTLLLPLLLPLLLALRPALLPVFAAALATALATALAAALPAPSVAALLSSLAHACSFRSIFPFATQPYPHGPAHNPPPGGRWGAGAVFVRRANGERPGKGRDGRDKKCQEAV
jgi:hypothetical protein